MAKPSQLTTWLCCDGEKMNDLLIKLFGWHRYRMQFAYKNKNGRIVFSFTKTIGVKQKRTIDNHREIKVALGPIYNQPGIPRHSLHNGTIDVEPVCYLGRWN